MDKLNGFIFWLKLMTYQENIVQLGIKSAPIEEKNWPASLSRIKKFKNKNEVTDFYDKKIIKVGSNHSCLAVISLDSACKKDDNYYLQVFLKECKYIEKKVVRHMII